MILGLPTYAESIICTQEAEIYFLGLKNYDRLIEKRNPQAIDMMRNLLHTKLTLHFQRMSEDKLPLFRFFLYTLDEKERTNLMRDAHQTVVCTKPSLCRATIDSLRRGPLVNLFGPGSVFYIIRMREKDRKKRAQRNLERRGPAAPTAAAATGAGGAAGQKEIASLTHLLKPGKRNIIDDMVRGIIPNIDIDASILDSFQSPRDFPTPQGTSRSAPVVSTPYPAEFEYSNMDAASAVAAKPSEDRRSDWYDELHWTVGDEALSELEDRIQAWYNSFGDSMARMERTGNKPVRLHRFQVEVSLHTRVILSLINGYKWRGTSRSDYTDSKSR